jgi:hypothetical protein
MMNEQSATVRPENVKVQFRRMKFDFEDGFPRYWHADSPFITLFWNALSHSFPSGEKLFIDSVRAVRDQITDPDLLEEIDHFIAQEAHHTAQHQKFNKMVSGQGFDMERIEARYVRLTQITRDEFADKPHAMLAVTMALEHFTAGFARQYLTNPAVSEGAHERVAALWAWHAAEEAEHKSTAFDVFNKIGGSYRTRVLQLAPAWFLIISVTLRSTFELLKQEGKLGDFRDIARGLWYLFGRRGLVSNMLPAMLQYYRGAFHPWQKDDSGLIEKWAANYGHFIEQLGFDGNRAKAGEQTAPASN